LEAFVGPCPVGMEACHDPDPDPANNTRSNLRWDTPKANATDRHRHGRTARGERQGNAKLADAEVECIRWLVALQIGLTQSRVARMFGTSPANVTRIIRRRGRIIAVFEKVEETTP
jgi:hypothetical protein